MANSDSTGDLFEENYVQINKIINLHISKWKLKVISSVSHDDIRQEILIHLHRKWHLYDNTQPLGNWLSTVICNKLKNLTRDQFYKFSRPCLNCPHFSGGDLCNLYGEVSSECGLYKKWMLEKKFQHDCALPVTIEDHQNQLHSMPSDNIDVEEQIIHLKHKLQEKLNKNDYLIFCCLFLENKTEEEVCKILNYKTARQCNLQIKNLKQIIVPLVKNIIKNEEEF